LKLFLNSQFELITLVCLYFCFFWAGAQGAKMQGEGRGYFDNPKRDHLIDDHHAIHISPSIRNLSSPYDPLPTPDDRGIPMAAWASRWF
jgi:hypothetical protein